MNYISKSPSIARKSVSISVFLSMVLSMFPVGTLTALAEDVVFESKEEVVVREDTGRGKKEIESEDELQYEQKGAYQDSVIDHATNNGDRQRVGDNKDIGEDVAALTDARSYGNIGSEDNKPFAEDEVDLSVSLDLREVNLAASHAKEFEMMSEPTSFQANTVCVNEKVHLNLSYEQTYSGWLTGWVRYETPFGSSGEHSLPKGDHDVWSIDTNNFEITDGVTTAMVTGLVFPGLPIKVERTAGYSRLNCDQTDAVTQITSPIKDEAISAVYRFSGTATDELSGVEKVLIRIGTSSDNENVFTEWVEFDSDTGEWFIDVDTTNIPDGIYNVRARAIDRAGNEGVSGMHVLRDFIVDNTDPSFAIVSPSDKSYAHGTQTIKAEISDDSDITKVLMTVKLNDGKNKTYVWENGKSNNSLLRDGSLFYVDVDTNLLAEGSNYIVLRATDTAGNTRYWNNNANNRQHVFYVDRSAPVGTIIYKGGGLNEYIRYISSIGELSFVGDFTDNVSLDRTSYVVWQVDSELKNRSIFCGNWNANASTSTPLSGTHNKITSQVKDCGTNLNWVDGHYEIGHRVYDEAGHFLGLNTPTEKFVIDSIAPEITIKDGFAGNKDTKYFSNISFKLFDAVMADKYILNGHTSDFTNNRWSDANFENIKGRLVQGENTITLYDVAGNSSSYTFYFDNLAPVANIASPNTDGQVLGGNITVTGEVDGAEKNIKSHWFEVRNPDGTYSYSHNMNTEDLSYSFELDTSAGDGEYRIRYVATDRAGNRSDTGGSTVRTLVVDNTAPTAPVITTPGVRQWFNSSPILNEWSKAFDSNGIYHYQVAYNYGDGHEFGGVNTCPGVNIPGAVGYVGCRDVDSLSRNHVPETNEQGKVTVWVRAVDNAGNVGPWSAPVYYYYDHESPITDIKISSVEDGKFTVSGHATDNEALNRVHVQLVHRESSTRHGGVTINLIPEGKSANWTVSYDAAKLPEGTYAAHVSVVDRAGNHSYAGWTENFLVEKDATTVTDDEDENQHPSTIRRSRSNGSFLLPLGQIDGLGSNFLSTPQPMSPVIGSGVILAQDNVESAVRVSTAPVSPSSDETGGGTASVGSENKEVIVEQDSQSTNLAAAFLGLPDNLADGIKCLAALVVILILIWLLTLAYDAVRRAREMPVAPRVKGRIAFISSLLAASTLVAVLVPFPCIILILYILSWVSVGWFVFESRRLRSR